MRNGFFFIEMANAAEPFATITKHPHDMISPRKVLLCVWWNIRGIIHWDILSRNQTLTGEVHYAKLERLETALEKRPSLLN